MGLRRCVVIQVKRLRVVFSCKVDDFFSCDLVGQFRFCERANHQVFIIPHEQVLDPKRKPRLIGAARVTSGKDAKQ